MLRILVIIFMKRIITLVTATVFTAVVNVQAQNFPVGIVSVQDSVKSVQVGVISIADPKLYAIPAEGAQMFGPECYHLHDYGFFFNNLKQNVADRVAAFMEKLLKQTNIL